MAAALIQLLRSRWLTWTVHVALWVLLYLAAINLGGKAPVFHEGQSGLSAVQPVAPVAKLDPLFSPGLMLNAVGGSNLPNPFFTRHFIPPAPVAPPPPTTRKLEVTYQGFYQTESGPKFAVMNLAGGLLVTKVGTLLATNWFVADVSFKSMLLTNATAQTNLLELNTKKEIEVPIR